VTLVLVVVGVAAGLAMGGVAGWRGGKWAVGFPDRYWTLNAAAFLGALGLDIAGLFLRQPWLSYGALGLMAGLITGLKYGYSPELRLWEPQPELPDDLEDDEDGDACAAGLEVAGSLDSAYLEDEYGAPKDAVQVAARDAGPSREGSSEA
jgi:hypothetical protein